MISRIVKDNALSDLPASCFGSDPQSAITLGHYQRQMAAQQAAAKAAMGLNATVRLQKGKSGGCVAWQMLRDQGCGDRAKRRAFWQQFPPWKVVKAIDLPAFVVKLGFIPVTHQRAYPFGFSAYLISMCQKHLCEGVVGSQVKHI